ncbi:hypothetical protein Taro_030930, partial [Colocasia esculenta]|nr:hypothetical protein [Colocasia esculenta]
APTEATNRVITFVRFNQARGTENFSIIEALETRRPSTFTCSASTEDTVFAAARRRGSEVRGISRLEFDMAGRGRVVCVTGAGGFTASWLVKLLLEQGYTVHGTVRDPNDEKNAHLKKLGNATENLRLFKADLLDYVSLSASIAGCEGVFHTACPVPPSKVPNPETEMVAPALNGTLNVLKACSEAKVRRVVVVSSVSAVNMNPIWPRDKILDEQCWSDKEFCKTTENWYCFSKTIAEEKALDYAKESGLDVVTVCPSLIIGPMLQLTVNASSLVLVKILKGFYQTFYHFFGLDHMILTILLW